MNTQRSWLAGLLVLQLALAGTLAWSTGTGSRPATAHTLLEIAANDIDRLVIDTPDSSANLRKQGGQWRLPNLENLPAATARVDQLVEQVAALRGGWPVATSASSHERFEVDEERFAKRLRLYRGDTLAGELYVGGSAGLRKSHVRAADDEAVYSVEINNYDLLASDTDWLDKALLAIDKPETIGGPGYAITRAGEGWRFTSSEAADPNNPGVDNDGAASLVGALQSLRIQDMAQAADAEPDVTLEVGDAAGTFRYRFWQRDGEYLVQRDDIDVVFSLSQYQYDQLAGVNRDSLVAKDARGESTPDNAAQSEAVNAAADQAAPEQDTGQG